MGLGEELGGAAMVTAVYIVAGIIIVSGLVGGWAAYLAQPAADPAVPETRGSSLRRFLLLGVIASACVPLFLSLLKSDVVRNVFATTGSDGKTPLPPAYESYLIFIGLCLIAAFSSRRFIESVSNQVLERRVDEANDKADRAAAAARTAKEVAQEVADEVEAADNNTDGRQDSAAADLAAAAAMGEEEDDGAPVSLTPVERSVLQALARKTYRTRIGIAEDSGVSRNRISELLESLAERKLALPTRSPQTGGARWIITRKGSAALES
jgi:hypothetical protein